MVKGEELKDKASSSVFSRPTKQEWKDKVQGEFEANGKNLKA
jgi:hypothetical protein